MIRRDILRPSHSILAIVAALAVVPGAASSRTLEDLPIDGSCSGLSRVEPEERRAAYERDQAWNRFALGLEVMPGFKLARHQNLVGAQWTYRCQSWWTAMIMTDGGEPLDLEDHAGAIRLREDQLAEFARHLLGPEEDLGKILGKLDCWDGGCLVEPCRPVLPAKRPRVEDGGVSEEHGRTVLHRYRWRGIHLVHYRLTIDRDGVLQVDASRPTDVALEDLLGPVTELLASDPARHWSPPLSAAEEVLYRRIRETPPDVLPPDGTPLHEVLLRMTSDLQEDLSSFGRPLGGDVHDRLERSLRWAIRSLSREDRPSS